MPNILLAATAVVSFILLAVTICISIALEDWHEDRTRRDEAAPWKNWHPKWLGQKSASSQSHPASVSHGSF